MDQRKRASYLRKEVERGNRLLELYEKAPLLSEKQLYDYALEHAVRLTDSAIGFFHLVSDDQKNVILTTWNSEALKNCRAAFDTHYPIESAGNWVDCVRLKRPVIYNDFASSPNRKGLPEGHAPVHRFMSIPVLEGDKVRIIFGVGNKSDEYDEHDVLRIQLVANELQKIIVQRRAEEALRASELKYREIFENVSDSLYLLEVTEDGHFRNLELNRAFEQSTGLPRSQLLGKLTEETVPQETAEIANAKYRRCVAAGTVIDEEVELELLTGRRTYNSTLIPVHDESGRIYRIIGISRDVTESKRAAELLQKSEERYRVLIQKIQAAVVVHGADTRVLISNAMAQELLGLSEDQLQEMTATDPALHFFREDGTVMPHEEYPVSQVLAARRSLRNLIVGVHRPGTKNDVWVLVNADPVFGSDDRIVQIIVTFVDISERRRLESERALVNRTITITTSTAGYEEVVARFPRASAREYVRVSVADTGVGMDEATKQRIYDPFFTTKAAGKGTGLGLALAHSIVESHHGMIAVDSAPGKGTTFELYFPVEVRTIESPEGASQFSAEILSGTETILLIEDEEMLCELVRGILVDRGYRVLTARDGEEGVAMFIRHGSEIALVLSDLGLPKLGGDEVCRRIKAIEPTARVILASGFLDPEVKAEMAKTGVR